jgi:hypothetical protein
MIGKWVEFIQDKMRYMGWVVDQHNDRLTVAIVGYSTFRYVDKDNTLTIPTPKYAIHK